MIPTSDALSAVAFSGKGDWLLARTEKTVRFVRTDQFEERFKIPSPTDKLGGIAIHADGLVATATAEDSVGSQSDIRVDIWSVDFDSLTTMSNSSSRTYSVAKVVILGERQSGKSSLASILIEQGQPTLSPSHELAVHCLKLADEFRDSRCFSRDVAFWDLSNSVGYNLLQALHLKSAAVTIFGFDSTILTGSGAADYLERVKAAWSQPLIPGAKILVATKVDQSNIRPRDRSHLSLEQYFGARVYLASSLAGIGISELRGAILSAINWAEMQRLDHAETYAELRHFRDQEHQRGVAYSSKEAVKSRFLSEHSRYSTQPLFGDFFDKALHALGDQGLMYQFSLADQILMDPRRLDAYLIALSTIAARDELGLHRVPEEYFGHLAGELPVPNEHRLQHKDQELLLLRAVREDLLRHDLAFAVSTANGAFVVLAGGPISHLDEQFQSEAGWCDLKGSPAEAYNSLVVKIAGLQDVLQKRTRVFRDAAIFETRDGGKCYVKIEKDSGRSRFAIGFDQHMSKDNRTTFIDFCRKHFGRASWIEAPGSDRDMALSRSSQPREKEEDPIPAFMSFRATKPKEAADVEKIASELRSRGVTLWLETDLEIGEDIERARDRARAEHSIALFAIGESGFDEHMRADCASFESRNATMIPMLLPSADPSSNRPSPLEKLRAITLGLGSQQYVQLAETIKRAWQRAKQARDPAPLPTSPLWDAFLSHSSDDKDVVQKLWKRLTDCGFHGWYDRESMRGQHVRSAVQEALNNSRRIIVCLNSSAAKSSWVEGEIEARLRENPKSVLTVQVGAILINEIDPRLRGLRHLNPEDPRDWETLMDMLRS